MSPILQPGVPSETDTRAGANIDRGKIIPLRVEYQAPTVPWTVAVDPEFVADLLKPWGGKQRAFLVGLLNGLSRTKAAARTGITLRSTQLWARKDPAYAEAATDCESIGVATVLEPELYRRALAGPADRDSLRALELVLKSRCPEYRP